MSDIQSCQTAHLCPKQEHTSPPDNVLNSDRRALLHALAPEGGPCGPLPPHSISKKTIRVVVFQVSRSSHLCYTSNVFSQIRTRVKLNHFLFIASLRNEIVTSLHRGISSSAFKCDPTDARGMSASVGSMVSHGISTYLKRAMKSPPTPFRALRRPQARCSGLATGLSRCAHHGLPRTRSSCHQVSHTSGTTELSPPFGARGLDGAHAPTLARTHTSWLTSRLQACRSSSGGHAPTVDPVELEWNFQQKKVQGLLSPLILPSPFPWLWFR